MNAAAMGECLKCPCVVVVVAMCAEDEAKARVYIGSAWCMSSHLSFVIKPQEHRFNAGRGFNTDNVCKLIALTTHSTVLNQQMLQSP